MNFFAFGLGYCACDFIFRNGERFAAVAGTIRDSEKPRALDGREVTRFNFDREDDKPYIVDALGKADVLLISVPPGLSVDPVLVKFGRQLAGLPQKLKIVYLSSIGVYGDRKGEWVDEERIPKPQNGRSLARLHAEKAWMSLSRGERGKTVHILRLAGIYGPDRNALKSLRDGTAHRYIKPNQVFNRIHVEDISAAIAAVIDYEGGSEIWNVSDDEPAPPQDVVTYAASLMGIEPPPEIPIEKASLTPMGRSFYAENRRASNRKLKETLGIELAYPTYREGLTALWEAGEGQA